MPAEGHGQGSAQGGSCISRLPIWGGCCDAEGRLPVHREGSSGPCVQKDTLGDSYSRVVHWTHPP